MTCSHPAVIACVPNARCDSDFRPVEVFNSRNSGGAFARIKTRSATPARVPARFSRTDSLSHLAIAPYPHSQPSSSSRRRAGSASSPHVDKLAGDCGRRPSPAIRDACDPYGLDKRSSVRRGLERRATCWRNWMQGVWLRSSVRSKPNRWSENSSRKHLGAARDKVTPRGSHRSLPSGRAHRQRSF